MLKRGIAVVMLLAIAGCHARTVIERLVEARRLSSNLLVQMTKASEASNRAVMADSSEAAAALAREADQATTLVQQEADALAPILADLEYTREVELLTEFRSRFEAYRTLDRSILDLAVEGTNIKARRLSFGPALDAADEFQRALETVRPAGAANRWRVAAIVSTAIARVREVQMLQAPHIAEPDDGTMTTIEARMNAAEVAASGALKDLKGFLQRASLPKHDAAIDVLERFKMINAQIVDLSRRNSNVRSLALSINQKRTLVAACEDSLRALQDALAARGEFGTR